MNIGNVNVNKVRKMIYGLSEEEINPSEGYIIKQERKVAIESGQETFEDAYVKDFYREFDRIMLMSAEENKADYNKYYGKDERTLILRILKYKDSFSHSYREKLSFWNFNCE
jgi:hypothetical protein